MGKYYRERRISTRVRGLELNLLDKSGLSNSDVVRYGLRKYYEEHPLSNEHKIITEISFLQDKIEEYELQIEANKLLIEKRIEELEEVYKSTDNKIYNYIIGKMYDTYLSFMDNNSLSDEYRSDLKNFYSYHRDAIEIIAMKIHKTSEYVIRVFEEYLEFKFSDDVLGEDLFMVE